LIANQFGNCYRKPLEHVIDVVSLVFQAELEVGFLKNTIENIDSQETTDE